MQLLISKIKTMKRTSLLGLDMLQKEELASLKGGIANTNKTCACVCVGPITSGGEGGGDDGDNGGDPEDSSSDSYCTDCGAANAFRATNKE